MWDEQRRLERKKSRILKLLVVNEPNLKPKRDIVNERYQKVLKHIKEKERIVKRNQKLLRKWKRKQKYYEKKLGLTPQPLYIPYSN